MLRNIVQATICGLILFGCSNTSPLIKNDFVSEKGCINNIKISGDVYYAYTVSRILKASLAPYSVKLSPYKIDIYLTEESDNTSYSEKKLIKEQTKIIYRIKILDKNHNELLNKSMDSITTYEVEDNMPFASIASKKQAASNIINEISNNIALIIIDFLN